jgi:hypothetical protein
MELAIGNFLTFTATTIVRQRFQNFFIGQTTAYQGNNYLFAPFGFSGITVNRTGDGIDASVGFPNNDITRAWAVEAIESRWLAHVQVVLLNPDDNTDFTLMHEYYGQISGGKWDEGMLGLALSNVLDAVGFDVPVRRLSQKLIGAIPVTTGVTL